MACAGSLLESSFVMKACGEVKEVGEEKLLKNPEVAAKTSDDPTTSSRTGIALQNCPT